MSFIVFENICRLNKNKMEIKKMNWIHKRWKKKNEEEDEEEENVEYDDDDKDIDEDWEDHEESEPDY